MHAHIVLHKQQSQALEARLHTQGPPLECHCLNYSMAVMLCRSGLTVTHAIKKDVQLW